MPGILPGIFVFIIMVKNIKKSDKSSPYDFIYPHDIDHYPKLFKKKRNLKIGLALLYIVILIAAFTII